LKAKDLFIRKGFKKNNQIITISNSTKNDLCKVYNRYSHCDKKTKTIFNGYKDFKNVFSEPNFIKSLDLKNPYLLFIGLQNNYKNCAVINEALENLSKRSESLGFDLIQVSGKHCLQKDLLISNKYLFLENISDQELKSLYENAAAHVLPSKKEGFGLTILESFSVNTPVVAFENKIFLEIAENFLITFKNAEDLIEKLNTLKQNPPTKNYREVLKKFLPWEATARNYLIEAIRLSKNQSAIKKAQNIKIFNQN
jgi:glycosyltransferase involved in cell wall biosynthesis